MLALTDLCNQTIRWMGLSVRAPRDWQVVRHGLSASRGQLALIDRYRQRMTVNWTQCEGEPDLERMVEDYRSKQLEAHGDAEITELTGAADRGGWVGTQRRFEQSDQWITQAVRYDAATRRLIEVWVMTSGGAAGERGLVEAILDGVEVVEPADAVTRWRAFDVDVTLPTEARGEARGEAGDGAGVGRRVWWRLTGARVRPADVKLTWAEFGARRWRGSAPTGRSVTVRRMGMAEMWYDGDAAGFLRKQFPRARGGPGDGLVRGRRVVESRGWEDGPRLKRVLGLLRRRQDVAWRCERCDAVYHVSVMSYRGRPLEVESVEVCCEAEHA